MPSSWNVMIYMSGDNTLREECLWALEEIRKLTVAGQSVAPKSAVTVLVQFDPGLGIPPHRYVVNSRKGSSLLAEAERIPKPGGKGYYESLDFADPTTLVQFIQWGRKRSPADKYMLVLSGHGGGADEDLFLQDTTAGSTMTIQEINKALKMALPGRTPLDILGFDSCFMSTVELAYELRRYAKYLVASEGTEPNTGWPFHEILPAFLSNPAAQPDVLAREIVKSYVRAYETYPMVGQSVQLAALDLGRIEDLTVLIDELSHSIRGNMKHAAFKDAVILAHWECQSFKYDQYADLYDFCDLLKGRIGDCDRFEETFAICDKITNLLDNQGQRPAVLLSCYAGPVFQHARGLSIYFPWSIIPREYRNLSFLDDTAWKNFLKTYIADTRRLKRSSPGQPALTAGSIENAMHNPAFSIQSFDRAPLIAGGRYDPPRNKGAFGKIRSMKNPPYQWDKCNCT